MTWKLCEVQILIVHYVWKMYSFVVKISNEESLKLKKKEKNNEKDMIRW